MKIRKFNAIIAFISASLALSSCSFFEKGETSKTPTESTLLAVDDRANSYVVGEIFDNYVTNGGLTPKVRMSDNTEKVLTKTDFTYEIKTAADSIVTGTKPFTTSGNYTVTVSKLKLKPVSYTIRVNPKEEPTPVATLTSISVTGYSDEVYQGDEYVFSGTVIATYSDKTTKDVTSDAIIGTISTDTLGEKQLRILYKEGDVTRQLVLTIKVVEKPAVDVKITSITFSQTSKSLVAGNTYTVTPTISPSNATNKSLTWSSSNSDVAIVSSGLITARAVGNARITATAKDGSNKSAYIDIEVTPVLVTKITLLPTSKTIEVGDTFTLTKTIAPSNATNKEVEWESSNSSVATISGGVVTAVGTGTATITATAKDGSGCKATCSVTVNAKPIKVTSITLSDTSINLTKGSTKALTATVSPSNATEQGVTWSSNSSTVASVSTSGLVTAKKTGTATITATAKDGSGIKTTCTVKVTTPVTGISLNKATLSLNKGASETLTATIAPSDADNKNVTWSGSANGITVDSSGKVTVLSTATAGKTATIVATSAEDSSIKAQCVVTVSDAPLKDAWTIMIYMCGADLESKNGLASGDIAEILSVSGQPDNVNIVIQTGGAASWEATYGISSSYNQRYHVQNKKLVCDNSKVYSSYKSMGESSTLADFVEWGITKYPAEKTGLIFWNHGGAMFGCCYDEKKDDDTIINSEAVSAFETAFTKTKTSKLEFVGYDCCLMQVQDIAEFNSEYFNYMVASEESESGYGWDYDTWIDDLYANKPTETILTSIVDGFIYENNYVYYTDGSREYDPSSNDQTLSWLDLSKATAYKNAFETFASALLTKISSVNKSTFSNWVINNVKHFAGNDYDYFALFDAYNFINKIKSNSSYNPGGTYAQDALTAFSNLVKYSNKGQAAGNAYGLGLIYACTESDPRYYSVSDFYLSSETNFTNWRNFNLSKGYLVDYD